MFMFHSESMRTCYQKITISIFRFFKILLFQVAFLIFFSIAIFSPCFLVVGLLLLSVALFQSRELVKYLEQLQTDVELPSLLTSQLNGCPHFFVFLF